MSALDESTERAMTKWVTRYVQDIVPEHVDLWPAVRERLAERRRGATDLINKQLRSTRLEWLLGPATPPAEMPPATKKSARPASTRVRVAAGLAALLVLLVFAGIAAWPDSRQAQRVEIDPGQGADVSTVLFSVPLGEGGAQSLGPVLALGEDGSFWFNETDISLLHYSSKGSYLGQTSLPPEIDTIRDVKLRAAEVWVLAGAMEVVGTSRVHKVKAYRLSLEGRKLAEYLVPKDVESFQTMLVTRGRDVILRDKYDGDQFWQLVDAKGVLKSRRLNGYPRHGNLDSPYASGKEGSPGYVSFGDTRVTVYGSGTRTEGRLYGHTFPYSLRDIAILMENPDGSFYVQVTEYPFSYISSWPDAGPHRAILHYAADGRLLHRTRYFEDQFGDSSLPYRTGFFEPQRSFQAQFVDHSLPSRHLALGSRGIFSALKYRNSEGSMQFDIQSFTIFDAGEPLPPYPTSEYYPFPAPTNAPATLDTLTHADQADLIAHVRLNPRPRTPNFLRFDAEPVEWLKGPNSVITDHFTIWVQDQSNGVRAPDTFRDGSVREYIVFLYSYGRNARHGSPAYFLMRGGAGAFSIQDGKIGYAGLPEYRGMNAHRFKNEIRPFITPTPTPRPTRPATSTPRPTSTPIRPVTLLPQMEQWIHVASLPVGNGPGQVGYDIQRSDSSPLGPNALAVAPDGTIYLLDTVNRRVHATTGDMVTKTLHIPDAVEPRDIVATPGGLFILDTAKVLHLTYDGGLVKTYTLPAGLSPEWITRLYADPGGRIRIWAGYREFDLENPAAMDPGQGVGAASASPTGITAPDGAKWYAYPSVMSGMPHLMRGTIHVPIETKGPMPSGHLVGFDRISQAYMLISEPYEKDGSKGVEVSVRRYRVDEVTARYGGFGASTGAIRLLLDRAPYKPRRPVEVMPDGTLYTIVPGGAEITIYRLVMGFAYDFVIDQEQDQ